MADTFSTAKLGLGVDTKQFNKEIDRTSTTTERALASMKLSADSFSEKWGEMTAGIKDTKRIISGILVSQAFYTVSQGLVLAAGSALDFSKNMETAAISMEYFVEGADKAAKAAAYLRTMNTFAARTPFTTEETLSLSKYMQAVGVSMNATKSFLAVITDTAAATGATEENLQRIVFGLGQMMTKGRLANEEIRQLANANIPIYEILQEELGLTGEEISNIGKNWVSADKAVVAILNGLEKRYDGAADRIADTVTGMTDTILDNAKIITQIASSGIYDALADKMGTVRDALDRYREIVTTEGSMGLFDQILKDMDSSGEVGTMLLALIGNTRQLSVALQETYISAKPLVKLFGKSLYASITVAEITITSFSQIVNSLVKGLNKLGITSGTTAEVISSLFIAYKAAKWMAFLGEGATTAAYSLYQAVSGASALLPASLQASAGVKLLSSSLIGLATYGLAAFGIFKMLNSAMAGLDTSKSAGNLFPDDYSTAMKKYQEEMDAYNQKIAAYQKDFEAPYNEISDGSGTAVAGLEAVSDASKKAAASVKSDWTAAFDEVYSIPDQNSGAGGSGDAPVPPDFGSLLTLPSFNFPDLSEVELKMPDFPWSDVFDNGLLDSDVLDGDWWKALLPFVIGGGAIQLGKILASNNKNLSDTLDTAAKNVTETILANKAAQKAAFTTLANSYDDVEALLSKTLAELRNPKLSNEARELLERNLSKLVDSGQKTVAQLNEVQDALLLTGSARKSTAVFDLAKQQDALNKINSSLSHIEELNLKLSDAAFAQTTAGHASLQELKQLKEATIKQYVGYAGDYGSDEVIEGMAKQLGLDIPNLSNSIEAVRGKLLELISIAEDGFSDVARAQGLLKETKGLLSHIAEDSSMLGLQVKGLDALQAQLSILNDGLKATTKASLDKELLTAVRNVLNNKDALNELKLLNSTTTTHLEELSTKYAEGFVENQKISKAVSDIAITFDDVRMSAISLQQTQINMNKLFARNIDNLVNRQLPTIMGQLGSVDKYGAGLLRQTVEGRNLLTKLDKNVEVAIGSITKETEALRKPLEEIRQVTKGLVSSNMKTSGLVTKHYGEIADAIVEIGSASKANAEAVDKALDTFSSLVETRISKSTVSGVETAIKQLGISAAAKPGAINTDAFKAEVSKARAELLKRSKTADEYDRKLFDKVAEITDRLAIRTGVNPADITDKYRDFIDGITLSAKDDFLIETGGGAWLLDSKVTKTDFEKAVAKIGAEIADVPTAQADAIGKGIRSEATFLLEQLEASQTAEWKNFIKVLREGGVFDVSKALASGGDFGALMLGQTSFGKTAFDALIDNLFKDSILKGAFPGNVASATNMKASLIGQDAEELAKRLLSEYLAEGNRVLYKTSTYVDETRKILTQLDSAIGDSVAAQFPADIKVLGSASYNKLVGAVEAIGENIDGKTIKLTAEGFNKLMKIMPDYALQIAAQAQVLGTSNAALAVFNHEATGLTDTLSDVSKLDVTTDEGIRQLESAVRKAIMDGIADAGIVDNFKNSLRLLEFDIPDSAKQVVLQLADDLRQAEMAISKFAASGASIEDLIYVLSNKTVTGADVGAAGIYRYIGQNFTWNRKSLSEINQAIGRIEPLLKSGNTAMTEIGMTRLKQIEDAINAAIRQNSGLVKTVDEIRVSMPSMKLGGGTVEFMATGEELLKTLSDIRAYSNVMTGYQYALVTQFNDAIRQLNEYKELGKSMSDVAYTTMRDGKETQVLISDIAQRAANNARTLEDLYGVVDKKISRQLMQMIDQGTLGTFENPFQIARASDIAKLVDNFENGVSKLATLPSVLPEKVGNAVTEVTQQVDETVNALKAGAQANSEAAELLKQGSEAFSKTALRPGGALPGRAAKTLPTYVYHVTPESNVDSILKNGLAADSFVSLADETESGLKKIASAAVGFKDASGKASEGLVLLRIDTTKLSDTVRLVADQFNEIIPPTAITNMGSLSAAMENASKIASAASETVKAATKTGAAAEALAGVAATLNVKAPTLTDDALTKIFDDIAFDISKKYTLVREEGDNLLSASINGSRLAAAQGGAKNAFLHTSIYDDMGQLIYSPAYDEAEEALTSFFKMLDGLPNAADTSKLFDFLNIDDILKINIEALGSIIDAGKIAKISNTIAEQLVEAFGKLDIGEEVGVNLAKSIKDISSEIATRLYKAGVTSSDEVAELGSVIAKQLGDQLGGGNAEVAQAIAGSIRSVIMSNSKTFADTYANTASITDELSKGIDSFFSVADGVSDEVFEQATKTISETYQNLGDDLVKNLLTLTDGDLSERSLKAVKKYLEEVIDDGLGIASEDVSKYLNEAVTLLGRKSNKVYADEISYAVEETLGAATKQITETLEAITPEIRLSDDVIDLAGAGATAGAKAAGAAADAGKAGLTASDVIFGGTLSVGLLDVAALGLDAYFANKESKDINSAVGAYMQAYADNDTELASALAKLQANNVDLAQLASNGSNWFTAMFGAGDLGNSAWEAVGANVGITAAQAVGAGITAMVATAAWPATLAAAIIGGGGSLVYELTGGNTVGNKYTDAYIEARDNDTIYKNALKQGLSEDEARAYSDKAMSGYRKAVFDDLDNGFWKHDDLAKILYSGTPLLEKTDVLDYIFKEGNYDSELSRQFFKSYGDENSMKELRNSEYGVYMEAYANVEAFVDMLNELGDTNIDLAQLIEENKLGSVIQAVVDFKKDFDSSLQNKLDVFKEATGTTGFGDGTVVKREAQWNASDENTKDDAAGQAYVDTFNGMNTELLTALKDDYGILIGSTIKEFQNTSGQTIKELYSTVSVDYSKLKDDITAWSVKLPESLSLSGATLSANDIEVLAQAGIQINSDGTVTFTKALNEDMTGAQRETTLTLDDMSANLLKQLAEGGVSFAEGTGGLDLNLNVDSLSKNMSSALFRLSNNLAGQMSTDMEEALSGLGTVLDSGYFRITNKAVLNGETTISEYIKSMGDKAKELSPEVLKAIEAIDQVIAQGGETTAQSVATWADGIVMPSPIDADALTPEIEAAFSKIGISFEMEGDNLMMVVNRLGEQLKDGMTLIPQESWDSLNQNVKDGLKALGVTWTTEAGFVKVNIAGTLGSLVTTEDLEPVKTALEALGLEFETSGNRIMGIIGPDGQEIKDGLLSISTAIWNEVDPAVKEALAGLGITFTTEGDKTMLDLNSIVSSGIGEVVALFTEQPDFWNQIPQAVQQTLIDAGIATQDGMLQINRYTVSGLLDVGESWAGYWENMPEDTRKAFADAGIATSEGLFVVEKYLDETSIPAGVDAIIKKFDELPPEMQEAILASGEAINENGYVVYNATAATVQSVAEAINKNKTGAVDAANDMATQIANAVTTALQNISRLDNIKLGKTGGFLGIGAKSNVWGDPIVHNGITYRPEYTAAGKLVKYHYFDNRGIEHTTDDIYTRAKGGMADGLSLVGEEGREIAILPDGTIKVLGKDSGELVDLPAGTQVINNDDTEKVMKYTNGLSGVSSVRKLADGNTDVAVGPSAVGTFETKVTGFFTTIIALLTNFTTSNAAAIVQDADSAEGLAVAVHNVVKTVVEEADRNFNDLFSIVKGTSADTNTAIAALSDDIQTAIAEAADRLGSAISSIDVGGYYSDFSATAEDVFKSSADIIQEAKDEYAAATTDEERAAAHAKAEAERAKLGYSGGPDGSQYIPLDSLQKAITDGVSDGVSKGVKVVAAEEEQKTTIGKVKGSASGSLVTKDALYRAGEGGLNEAIIPLEKPEVLAKVGEAIAASTPRSVVTAAVTVLADVSINSLLSGIATLLAPALDIVKEANAVAIHNAVGTLAESTQTQHGELTDTLGAIKDSLLTSISEAAAKIIEAIGDIDISFPSSSFSSFGSGSSSGSGSGGLSSAEIIAQAKEDYANATTDEGRAAAHAKAEAERAKLGYSGGPDGSQYIPLDKDGKPKGSARGSLITKDALYRAGEFGLNEAIIPLENPDVLNKVGKAIYNSMPVEYMQQLRAAVGMKNAGITAPQVVQSNSYQTVQDTAAVVEAITQKVLENVLPAMSGTSQEAQTPIYVGTLVADDAGLKTLERKLYVIRQSEQARRS